MTTATEMPAPVIRLNGERVIVLGHRFCLVESRSRPGSFHSCEALEPSGVWQCTCESGTIRGRCHHITLVKAWLAGDADVELDEESARG